MIVKSIFYTVRWSDTNVVVISADEDSEENELLRQPMEDATKTAHGTSMDANTATTSELAPQASRDADITDQAAQAHDSEDEYIPIDSLFKEVPGNDDSHPVANDPALQAASDANSADQAVQRETTDLSEKSVGDAVADSPTAVSDNPLAPTSTDQIVIEKSLNLSENETHAGAASAVVVPGKLNMPFLRETFMTDLHSIRRLFRRKCDNGSPVERCSKARGRYDK